MTQFIGKIKINNSKTEITLLEEEKTDHSYITKETVVASDELRHPDFDVAAKGVMPWLIQILGIPKEWEVEMKNISIDREDGFLADIGLYVKFGKGFTSGVNMPAPKLIHNGAGENNKMPQQLYDAIMVLIDEANKFLFENKRAQGSLPLEDAEKTDEELEEEEQRKLETNFRSHVPKKKDKVEKKSAFRKDFLKAVKESNPKKAAKAIDKLTEQA